MEKRKFLISFLFFLIIELQPICSNESITTEGLDEDLPDSVPFKTTSDGDATTREKSSASDGNDSDSCINKNGDTCFPLKCLRPWWNDTIDSNRNFLAVSIVMVFLATFVPKILVRLIFFILTKFSYIRLLMIDMHKFCLKTTALLLSASLVWGSLALITLTQFLCDSPLYLWGIFMLVWVYSIFQVFEKFVLRRFGLTDNFSKKVVITESIKLLRIIVLGIVAAVIYLKLFGSYRTGLLYSFFGTIGLSISLGSMAVVHNSMGGLYLVFHAPFKVDDYIEIGDVSGSVERVALRYTTVTTLRGSTSYIPNSFFLYKPMVNYTQRPKRQFEILIDVAQDTPVALLRELLEETNKILQSLHTSLTSHSKNMCDSREDEAQSRFYFVAMDQLFKIRVFSYTHEIDTKKHLMIKSEVWLAIVELMEELGIKMGTRERTTETPAPRETTDGAFDAEYNLFSGSNE